MTYIKTKIITSDERFELFRSVWQTSQAIYVHKLENIKILTECHVINSLEVNLENLLVATSS